VSHRKPKNTAGRGIFTPPQVPLPVPVAQPPLAYPEMLAAPRQDGTPNRFTVRISVMPDPHATVATAELFTAANDYIPFKTVTGSSRRDNPDEYSPEIGTALAVSRALLKLGHQLGHQADSAVRHAESVRKHRTEVRERRILQKVLKESPAGKAVDEFLDHPETGVQRQRPKGRHARPE